MRICRGGKEMRELASSQSSLIASIDRAGTPVAVECTY